MPVFNENPYSFPSDTVFHLAVVRCGGASPNGLHISTAARPTVDRGRHGGGLDAGMRIEELAMLFEGKAIGHTSDIIADDSGHPLCRDAYREARGHLAG
jgi:hypothetical protein